MSSCHCNKITFSVMNVLSVNAPFVTCIFQKKTVLSLFNLNESVHKDVSWWVLTENILFLMVSEPGAKEQSLWDLQYKREITPLVEFYKKKKCHCKSSFSSRCNNVCKLMINIVSFWNFVFQSYYFSFASYSFF